MVLCWSENPAIEIKIVISTPTIVLETHNAEMQQHKIQCIAPTEVFFNPKFYSRSQWSCNIICHAIMMPYIFGLDMVCHIVLVEQKLNCQHNCQLK